MSNFTLLSGDYFLHKVIPQCKSLSLKRRLIQRLEHHKESMATLIDFINCNGCDAPKDLDLFTKELDKIDNIIELVNIELFK